MAVFAPIPSASVTPQCAESGLRRPFSSVATFAVRKAHLSPSRTLTAADHRIDARPPAEPGWTGTCNTTRATRHQWTLADRSRLPRKIGSPSSRESSAGGNSIRADGWLGSRLPHDFVQNSQISCLSPQRHRCRSHSPAARPTRSESRRNPIDASLPSNANAAPSKSLNTARAATERVTNDLIHRPRAYSLPAIEPSNHFSPRIAPARGRPRPSSGTITSELLVAKEEFLLDRA